MGFRQSQGVLSAGLFDSLSFLVHVIYIYICVYAILCILPSQILREVDSRLFGDRKIVIQGWSVPLPR